MKVLFGKHQTLIYELTKKEFRARYRGSYLGVVWAVGQPLASILIIWFLFSVGFRSHPAGLHFPYILWLLAGIIPWFFINDGIVTGTGAILENAYLIKKVYFPLHILPLVRILAALVVTAVFIVLMLAAFFFYRFPLTVYGIQILYYLVACVVLMYGISWVAAMMTVFIKDIKHLVAIVMQFGFWLTAIFWPIKILPAKFRFLIRLNPFSYIIEGFRDSLIFHHWFLNYHLIQTIYFWGLTLLIYAMGWMLNKRLRPFLADYI